MAVLPRFVFAGNVPADGPLQGGGRSAVVSFELKQNCFWLWMVVQNELRTVWSMGADGPPLKPETGAETWLSVWGVQMNCGPSIICEADHPPGL